MLPGPTTIRICRRSMIYGGMAAVKIDYNPSAKNMFSFRYSNQGRSIFATWGVGAPNSDPANGNGQGNAPDAQTYAAQWTHVFSPNLLLNIGASAMNFDNNQLEGTAQSYNCRQSWALPRPSTIRSRITTTSWISPPTAFPMRRTLSSSVQVGLAIQATGMRSISFRR